MPRLNHTKSRRGCQRCKARKVKCDEGRPSCTWCRQRELPCHYDENPPPRRPPRRTVRSPPAQDQPQPHHHPQPQPHPQPQFQVDESSPEDISSTLLVAAQQHTFIAEEHDDCTPPISLSDFLNKETQQKRLLELAVFQYYLYNVSVTTPYTDAEERARIWQDRIPRLALSHPCLLYALYAMSTLHAWKSLYEKSISSKDLDFVSFIGPCLGSSENQIFRPSNDAALNHIDLLHQHFVDVAIREQMKAVNDMGRWNADAVCETSVLLAQCSMLQATHSKAQQKEFTYELPLRWILLIRSYKQILQSSKQHLHDDSITSELVSHFEPMFDKFQAWKELPESSQFAYLIDYDKYPESSPLTPEIKTAYRHACGYIDVLFRYITDGHGWRGLGRRMYAFLVVIEDEFLTCLREYRPRALVMFAHVMALAKPLHNRWFLFDHWADVHTKGLAQLVPTEWQFAMEWPLEFLVKHEDYYAEDNIPS